MPAEILTEPVQDSVPQLNNELAVGENLEFQRKWWRFENAIWCFFALIVLLDVAGAFGRGPLANARKQSGDGMMDVQYERVERFNTPSVMTIHFSPSAIHDGKIQLWASENLVKDLGAARVIPQPVKSQVGNGGVLYDFDASKSPATVQFALEPPKAGLKRLVLRAAGSSNVDLDIFVMP